MAGPAVRAEAARWALALGLSAAAHGVVVGVSWELGRAPSRAPELRLREGSAGASGPRVELIEAEPEAPAPRAGAAPSMRIAREVVEEAGRALDDAARRAASGLGAVAEAMERNARARAAIATGVERLVEVVVEAGADAESIAAALEERTARAGAGLEESRRVRALADEEREAARLAQAGESDAQAAPEGGSAGATAPARPSAGNRAPEYPAEARRRGQEGVVLLRLVVDATGDVTGVSVAESSGWPLLDMAAVRAARTWRFTPAMNAGAARASEATLPVRFRLVEGR